MIFESVPLRKFAYARSGDKGRSANIGVIAFNEAGYQFLRENLKADTVHCYFEPLGVIETERFELPNLLAFNFVLKGVLGEGGSRNLRSDSQGKALGQALLEMQLSVPEVILCKICEGE